MNDIKIGGNYLITTDQWFIGPDGRTYKAVWGQVNKAEASDVLGIKPNSKSTNWYLLVGDVARGMVIAGCQVHYAIKCDEMPNTGESDNWEIHNGDVKLNKIPSRIYIAQGAKP